MRGVNDQRLEETVNEALKKDPRIDTTEISVEIEDRIVYISGTVDSAAERSAVMENIEPIPGVGMVVDRLMLRNFVERSDDELKGAVKRTLIRDISVDAHPIDIEAKGGVITLSGRVASFSQKLAAENITWWTPGVTDVISHLQVDGVVEPPDDPDY